MANINNNDFKYMYHETHANRAIESSTNIVGNFRLNIIFMKMTKNKIR